MPHCYLHFEDDDGCCRDSEGFDAPDHAGALVIIRRTAADIFHEEIDSGSTAVAFYLCLDDTSGNRLMTLPIRAALGPSTG
jgi:hypothetical protein